MERGTRNREFRIANPAPTPPQGEGFSSALAAALARLKAAERTAAELRASLLRKYDAESVEAALAWLTERRLLSDDRAAEATVRPRASGRRAEGNARLRQRLEAKGTDAKAIEQALVDAPDEGRRMHDALAAKFKTPDAGQRGKAGRFLLSRGFDEEAVDGALDRFFGEG